MNRFFLVIVCIYLTMFSFGQNPYAVSVPSKTEDSKPKDDRSDFAKQFNYVPIYEWKIGTKFLIEPDKYDIGFDLDLVPYKSKNKYSDRIKVKDFAYKILTFNGFEEKKGTTYVQFECEGKKYEQETFLGAGIDKMKEYEKEGSGFMNAISHLIYVNEIDTVKTQLIGKKVWVLNRLWMRDNDKGQGIYQKDGLQYYPAIITQIGVGDADAPLRIVFKPDNQDEAFIDVFLSGINQKYSGISLHFDKAFAFEDPKNKYTKITSDNWTLIQNGKVKIGMTEEECKLSWGKPDKINSTIIDGLVTEQWVFGEKAISYLYLRNGLLTSIQD